MDESFWQKQQDKPLWPDLEWSRPQQKARAKKLAIIGGHAHGFDAVGRLYQASLSAGIGGAKAVLPSELKRLVGASLPDTVFTELAPEPGQLQSAKTDLLAFSEWADGICLVQTGNNSKTALLISSFLGSYDGPLIVTDDLVDLLKHDWEQYASRDSTLFVLSFEGLQKLTAAVKSPVGLRHDMGLRPLVLALRQISEQITAPITTVYEQAVLVGFGGQVVSTARASQPDPIMLAGWSATWWLQQPNKPLEALATAAFDF